MSERTDQMSREEHWRQTRLHWNRRGLWLGSLMAIFLVPAFGLLDFVSVPEQWRPISLALRLGVSVTGVGVLLGFRFGVFREGLVGIGAFYTLVIGLVLSALSYISGGFDSTYFSGLNLVMLAAGMLMVWPTRVSIVVYGTLVVTYIIPSLFTLDEANFTRALESTFFVFATAILLVIAQTYRYRSLRQQSDSRLEVERLTDELQLANAYLEELARVDKLTRVGNRLAFDERLGEEWSRTQRFESEMALLIFDVDEFKSYNDEFGHQKGDKALQAIAEAALGALSRPGDFIARYGGEEFAVILPNTHEEGTLRVAEKIRVAVEELGLRHSVDSERDVVTVSVGGASTEGHDFIDVESLVKVADDALYAAKDEGRNCSRIIRQPVASLRESR